MEKQAEQARENLNVDKTQQGVPISVAALWTVKQNQLFLDLLLSDILSQNETSN